MSSEQKRLVDEESFDPFQFQNKHEIKNEGNVFSNTNSNQQPLGVYKPQSAIQSQESVLKIMNSLLVLKQQEKKIGRVAKVHSVKRGDQENNLFQFQPCPSPNSEEKYVFAVDIFSKECFKTQKKQSKNSINNSKGGVDENNKEQNKIIGKEILIEGCLVNIYALKQLINLTQMNLEIIKIKACLFYESDKSVLKESRKCIKNEKQDKDSDKKEKQQEQNNLKEDLIIIHNNNKMLREINFSFRIKSLSLPLIKAIHIELINQTLVQNQQQSESIQKSILMSKQTLKKQKQKSLRHKSGSKIIGSIQFDQEEIKVTADQLVEQYECNKDSPFVDFELKYQPILEEKYSKYKNQKEVVDSIIQGNKQGKKETQECINQYIVNDIYEHVTVFNKYIKGSIYKDSILLIRGYLLEEPIGLGMINILITKNRERIKTVIFKETGTIPHECFLKISDALVTIPDLESIAFFDSQLEKQSYKLLKSVVIRDQSNFMKCLCQISRNLLIVLNRSSFDIDEYRSQVFGQVKVHNNEFNNLKQSNKKPISKHYAFFVVGSKDTYEFTPYQFQQLNSQLFTGKFLEKEEDNSDLIKFDIEKLIECQENYNEIIKDEIKKYEGNEEILTFNGISEQIIAKYQTYSIYRQREEKIDQNVLENDILILIKHKSDFSIFKARQLVSCLADKILQSKLEQELITLGYLDEHDISENKEDLQRRILSDIGLCSNIQIYLFSHFLINKKNQLKDILNQDKIIQNISKKNYLEFEYIKKLCQKNNNIQIELIFNNEQYNLVIVTQKGEEQKVEFTFDNKKQHETFYNSIKFLQFLKEIFTFFNERRTLQLCLSYSIQQNFNEILMSHFSLVNEQTNINLKLQIQGFGQLFRFPQINTYKKIQNLELNHFNLDKESLLGYNFETITFQSCKIKSFNNSLFQNLKNLNFVFCDANENELIEACEQFQSQQVSKKELTIQITIQCPSQIDDDSSSSGRYIELSRSSVASIMNFGERVKVQIERLGNQTVQYFQEQINQRFPLYLNQNLLKKMFGVEFSSLCNSLRGKNDSNDLINLDNQHLQCEIPISQLNIDVKENKTIQSENNIQQQYKILSNETQTICKQIKEIYSNNNNNQQQFYLFEKKQEIYQKTISECCKISLGGDFETFSQKYKSSLLNVLKDHTMDLCLFRTSIFQQRFKPKKVNIRFYNNLILNKAIIYDDQAMESIEELDFSNSYITDILQVKFIDYMIQLSPTLQKLNLKDVQMKEIRQNKEVPILITSLSSFKYLKKIDISKNNYQDQLPFFNALLQSKGIISLKVNTLISGENEEERQQLEHQYEALMKSILKNNKSSLRSLDITVFSKRISEDIIQCSHLEKLKFSFFQYSKFYLLEDILVMNQLRNIIIEGSEVQIRGEYLEYFLAKSIKSSLKEISLQLNNSNHSQISYFRNNQADNESINQIENHDFQVIQVSQQFNVQIEDTDLKTQKSISSQNFISLKPNLGMKLLFNIESITESIIIHEFKYLQVLLIDYELRDYKFLNQIFNANQQLTELIFQFCNLQNNSFEGVDFGKLPKTIKLLKFHVCWDLTQLQFLNPVYLNISQYSQMVLDIEYTSVSFSEIFRFIPHIKEVVYNRDYQKFYPIIQYITKDNLEEEQIIATIFYILIKNEFDESEIMLFYKLIFYPKIDLNGSKFIHFCPFIVSPLQVISSSYDLKKKILNNMEKQDDKFSVLYQLGNKYLFLIDEQLKEEQEYVLGYSKNYHGPHFYNLNNLDDNNKKTLENNVFIFQEYLQLIQKKEKLNLKQIHLPFNLELSYEILNNKQYNIHLNESNLIDYLFRISPSQVTIKDMSLQFLKAWYVINSISPLTFKTKIQNIDMSRVYNSSIGNFLTQKLNRNNFLKKLLSGTPHKYRYDETVQFLASHLDENIRKRQHIYLLSLYPLYIFICIFGVIYFSLYFTITCGRGISWSSYYCYLIYGLVTIFIELMMFRKCLDFISHLIPSFEIDLNPGCIASISNSIKNFIIDSTWINQWYMGYSYSFLQSQLARFDNFTNVAFLYSTYQCENYNIFYISLCFISIPFLHSLIEFAHVTFKPTQRYQLPTSSLDTYYKICNIIEFKAVADVLDLVSPSNVTVVHGRMYNSRIVSSFIRIIGESIPLIIIQIYNLTQNSLTSSLILSLTLSIITFLTLLINLLTIMPSTLSQEDFNKLNEKKKNDKIVENYEKRLQIFEDETFSMRFYEHLKKLRLQYLKCKKQGQFNQELENIYNANQIYFQQLFDSPKALLKEDQEE